MGRTSIPLDEETKNKLDRIKRDDETWDQFLERTALAEEPIRKGFLSTEGAEEVRKTIEKTRDSF